VLLAWGRSHRTSTDTELIRWGADLARVEGSVGGVVAGPVAGQADPAGAGDPGKADENAPGERLIEEGPASILGPALTIEVALVREGAGSQRKRIRVNGLPRRATGLIGLLRSVVFAPEEMLLVSGSPGLRRAALDQLAAQRTPAYLRDLATYGRALQQRNSLLRAIREEQAGRDQLRFWDETLLEAGGAIVAERLALLGAIAEPLALAHAEIAPDEAAAALRLRYETNAPMQPGESPREALARRLVETAEKEIWNGSTLVGPHRDDIVFEQAGRDLATFASRGQQRTAILAFKLAELDLLTELDGRPPLLLLDDVFSELDPDRRGHLVRRIAALPQAFVTTTTLDDLDPELRAHATSWEVVPAPQPNLGNAAAGATLRGPIAASAVAR
jgi:DNA replication and repair protein RecF